MKKKFLTNIVSVLVILSSLINSVSADTIDNYDCQSNEECFEFEFNFVHDLAIDEDDNLNGRASHGTCTHYGSVYFTNITQPSDIQTKYLATISHHKASINNCTEIMHWKIGFVLLAASGPATINPWRIKEDDLAIGRSVGEVFAGPPGTIFEWKFITTVAGVTDETESRRIMF